MKLSISDVLRLAQLARLHLSDEELLSLSNELTSILNYVDILREVDTDGVIPTAQVTGLSNMLREDFVDSSLCSPDALLECSPLPKKDKQIRIKRMIK